MLSEEEKRELLEMAGSSQLREEFRRLRQSPRSSRLMDLDRLMRFLTDFSRFSPARPPRESGPPYTQILL
ncbi:MAG: hypothetical protein A3J74_10525 [Elusimicrobia bacterium RIFCSPHIGHO2_02_FULL_57_9]|nr:MAG: hypothetical protein A3J74_10525 [Elusimicrobia bacterium RIFCSPHIGHO2_02_FULL_57_9]